MLRKVESEGVIPRKTPRLLVYPPVEKQKAVRWREPADGSALSCTELQKAALPKQFSGSFLA